MEVKDDDESDGFGPAGGGDEEEDKGDWDGLDDFVDQATYNVFCNAAEDAALEERWAQRKKRRLELETEQKDQRERLLRTQQQEQRQWQAEYVACRSSGLRGVTGCRLEPQTLRLPSGQAADAKKAEAASSESWLAVPERYFDPCGRWAGQSAVCTAKIKAISAERDNEAVEQLWRWRIGYAGVVDVPGEVAHCWTWAYVPDDGGALGFVLEQHSAVFGALDVIPDSWHQYTRSCTFGYLDSPLSADLSSSSSLAVSASLASSSSSSLSASLSSSARPGPPLVRRRATVTTTAPLVMEAVSLRQGPFAGEALRCMVQGWFLAIRHGHAPVVAWLLAAYPTVFGFGIVHRLTVQRKHESGRGSMVSWEMASSPSPLTLSGLVYLYPWSLGLQLAIRLNVPDVVRLLVQAMVGGAPAVVLVPTATASVLDFHKPDLVPQAINEALRQAFRNGQVALVRLVLHTPAPQPCVVSDLIRWIDWAQSAGCIECRGHANTLLVPLLSAKRLAPLTPLGRFVNRITGLFWKTFVKFLFR